MALGHTPWRIDKDRCPFLLDALVQHRFLPRAVAGSLFRAGHRPSAVAKRRGWEPRGSVAAKETGAVALLILDCSIFGLALVVIVFVLWGGKSSLPHFIAWPPRSGGVGGGGG